MTTAELPMVDLFLRRITEWYRQSGAGQRYQSRLTRFAGDSIRGLVGASPLCLRRGNCAPRVRSRPIECYGWRQGRLRRGAACRRGRKRRRGRQLVRSCRLARMMIGVGQADLFWVKPVLNAQLTTVCHLDARFSPKR